MDLLEPKAFVWCATGPHPGETLNDIVARKQSDIAKFGWCLWEYGCAGPGHAELEVRRLAVEYLRSGTVPLLVADSGIESTTRVAFAGFRVRPKGVVTALPAGMSPVRGATRSGAFHLTGLRSVDAEIDVGTYSVPFAERLTALPEHLAGMQGSACAARRRSGKPDLRVINIVGELAEPYVVLLKRSD